jgi:transposase
MGIGPIMLINTITQTPVGAIYRAHRRCTGPKLGDVNMTEELRFHDKIVNATISYRAGWWFVSIAVEVEYESPTHGGGTVGIDLGLKTLATLNDGESLRIKNTIESR